MFKLFTVVAGSLISFAASAAFANSSTYTDIVDKSCKTLSEYEAGATSKCAGLGDYPVYIKDGDARLSVFYGQIAEILIDKGFESFGAFNNIGDKIEWRLDDDGQPIAAILRWYISNHDDDTGQYSEKTRGQVLVVSRVAQPEDGLSCVVGYVDARANKSANELARKVADEEASSFACGYNEAFWHGERGPTASDTMNYLPEELKSE